MKMKTVLSSKNEKFYLSKEYYKKLKLLKVKDKVYSIYNLPDGLTVDDDLDIEDYEIDEIVLPKNLRVNGFLNLRKTYILETPENLFVKKGLFVNISHVKRINSGLICSGLDLSNSDIEEISDNILIKGNLNLNNTPYLKRIANGIKVNGDVLLGNSSIKELPNDFYIKHNLYIRDSDIKQLPKGLRIGKNLILKSTKITELPNDLKIKGKITGFSGNKNAYPQFKFF